MGQDFDCPQLSQTAMVVPVKDLRLCEAMRRRGYNRRTEECYRHWIRVFMLPRQAPSCPDGAVESGRVPVRLAAAPDVAARRRTRCSPRFCFFLYKHAGAELAVVCDSGARQGVGSSSGGAHRAEVGRRLVQLQGALWLMASPL
jgi:hypothetical protein